MSSLLDKYADCLKKLYLAPDSPMKLPRQVRIGQPAVRQQLQTICKSDTTKPPDPRWFCLIYRFVFDYSMMPDTTPDPTVLPPSLMANLSPSSMAIGVISSMLMVMLSPGMHISVPSGNCRSPVTSVVLK